MVGGTGVEPATTWMSTKRSTTELSAYIVGILIVRFENFAVKRVFRFYSIPHAKKTTP